MQKIKRFLLSNNLGIYVKGTQLFTFGGITFLPTALLHPFWFEFCQNVVRFRRFRCRDDVKKLLNKYPSGIYTVSQKTCDYIFYNNFNNKCPITIIFGIVSSKSMPNVLAVALMLQRWVCLSSVAVVCTECIVAKRCVLEQKLLLTAYMKSYVRNRLVPKRMTLTFL